MSNFVSLFIYFQSFVLAVGVVVVTKLPKQRTRRSKQNNTQMCQQYREGDF